MTRLLAVASSGGHWIQLLRLRPAFRAAEVIWLTTHSESANEVQGEMYFVRDANVWDKPALILMFFQVGWRVMILRPDVIVTTGAAPGFAAIVFGRLIGARTVWIDSIANADSLSLAGRKVRRLAHVWLTQWEHLARNDGPHYWGQVL